MADTPKSLDDVKPKYSPILGLPVADEPAEPTASAAGGADNSHGGMAPAGGAASMPSPQDLPPAKKK